MLEYEAIIKIIIAAILGGLIGLQRELDQEAAGLRTHMLVCIGATLFTIVSLYSSYVGDPTRIASGIVTGIGFLGAGTIFKDNNKIRGLTTAADLWVIASIGMAIGFGYYGLGIISTIIILVILLVKKIFQENYKKHGQAKQSVSKN
jgi:putative Mg2+ transporter-C (MgtC) family protein